MYDIGFSPLEDLKYITDPEQFATYKLKLEVLIPGFDSNKDIKIYDKIQGKYLN